MKNKVLALLPARYNSSRFFGKMLYKIGSKTLLQHSYDNIKNLKIFDDIFVATEDENIQKEAAHFKAKCIMTKKSTSGTHRIINALKENSFLKKSDIIVNIQADHPQILPSTIEKTINLLKTDPSAKTSTAVCEIDHDLAKSQNIVKCTLDQNNNALYFSRSLIPHSKKPQDIKYFYHIGLYAYRTDFLLKLDKLKDTPNQLLEDLEQLKILEHGYKMKVAIVDDFPIGVDVLEDITKVKKLICQ